MKRLIGLTFITLLMVVLGATASFAGSSAIRIILDGAEIATDSPPVIENGRTLAPVRAVFEGMGGTVTWNQESKEVTLVKDDMTVKLKIGSKSAYINGTENILDVPARIIKNRTMIPVRFVSEALGCEVSWDGKNRIVGIVSPSKETTDNPPATDNPPVTEDPAVITGIELSDQGDRVIVSADREISDYTSSKMTNPSRFVFDIKNAKLDMEAGAVAAQDNPYFKNIRYSQYAENTVRIVADLNTFASGAVSRSGDPRTIALTFAINEPVLPGKLVKSDGEISQEDQAILDQYGLSAVTEKARQKLVVIDPGHGGTDPGSMGYENGVLVLNEKDVNLDIGLRVQKMLEAAGASYYMIRTGDITVPLYDRQDTANQLDASLYVSLHNNSYSTATPNGTEVHYHGNDDPAVDGISAKALAENLQRTLVSNLGLTDRGIKASPELAVLRRTNMPAVIIEGAYISNPSDRSYMKTDEFREKYAKSVAKCIIDALNNSVE